MNANKIENYQVWKSELEMCRWWQWLKKPYSVFVYNEEKKRRESNR